MKRAREYIKRQREYMKHADSEYTPRYVLNDLIGLYMLLMRKEGTTIEEAIELDDDLFLLLSTLAKANRGEKEMVWLSGRELQESTGLSPNAVNFAVALLQHLGFVEWITFGRNYPFVFHNATITPSKTEFRVVERVER